MVRQRHDPLASLDVSRQGQDREVCGPQQQWRRLFGGGVIGMTNKFGLSLLLIVLGASGAAVAQQAPATAASPKAIACPPSIQVQQTPLTAFAAGWQTRSSNDTHPLANISFYAGPPEEMAQLAPSSEQRKAKTLTSRWLLAPTDRVYWVACEYAGTSAIVTRPLEKNIASCVAEHDPNSSPPVLKRWSCAAGQRGRQE